MDLSIDGQGNEVLEYAYAHGMDKGDVDEIYRKFRNYDFVGNNLVDVDEFVVAVGLQPEIFLMLVFRLFDGDMEGSITFAEFLMAYYQFLTLDKESLAIFTFSLFDLDNSNYLEQEETELMMRVLEGKVTRNDTIAYKALDVDGDGDVSLEEFLSVASKRPNMMFLAFETQMVLRSSCMSVSRWEELTTRRRDLLKKGSKKHGHVGFAEIMGWDASRKQISSQYAFLALKHIHGLPKGIKNKVLEAEHRVNLAKREKQKQRELKERQLASRSKAITDGKKHQEVISSKYEAMGGSNKAGPYDHVGARHTHTMTAGSSPHIENPHAHYPVAARGDNHSHVHTHGHNHDHVEGNRHHHDAHDQEVSTKPHQSVNHGSHRDTGHSSSSDKVQDHHHVNKDKPSAKMHVSPVSPHSKKIVVEH